MEKRKLTRIVFHMEASLIHNGRNFAASVENISLKGAYVKTHDVFNIELNEKIDMILYIKGESTTVEVNTKAVILRNEEKGTAILFDSLDLDSFIHLRNIIAYNNGNYDKIMNEFLENGFKGAI
jgi:hypothetical protein